MKIRNPYWIQKKKNQHIDNIIFIKSLSYTDIVQSTSWKWCQEAIFFSIKQQDFRDTTMLLYSVWRKYLTLPLSSRISVLRARNSIRNFRNGCERNEIRFLLLIKDNNNKTTTDRCSTHKRKLTKEQSSCARELKPTSIYSSLKRTKA